LKGAGIFNERNYLASTQLNFSRGAAAAAGEAAAAGGGAAAKQHPGPLLPALARLARLVRLQLDLPQDLPLPSGVPWEWLQQGAFPSLRM
jgi:hypothetical protein